MRKDGLLTSEPAGREARYRLTPAIDAVMQRVDRQLRGDRPAWGGSFSGVLFTIPERHRSYRDRLRRSAYTLGYVTLRPGLLVATTDRYDELTALLPAQPPGSQLLRTQLTLSPSDSRRVALELWELAALAARYRAVLAAADHRTSQAEQQPSAGPAAFRAFADAILPLFEASADDPDLPAELLPADWPGTQFGAAIAKAFLVFGPTLRDYVEAVTGHALLG
jgi:phenylacetic acid degradation operon negative regulatory protein